MQVIWNSFFEANPAWRAVVTAVDDVPEAGDVDYTAIADMLPLVDVHTSSGCVEF